MQRTTPLFAALAASPVAVSKARSRYPGHRYRPSRDRLTATSAFSTIHPVPPVAVVGLVEKIIGYLWSLCKFTINP